MKIAKPLRSAKQGLSMVSKRSGAMFCVSSTIIPSKYCPLIAELFSPPIICILELFTEKSTLSSDSLNFTPGMAAENCFK